METFRTEFGLDAAAGQWYYGLDLDYGPLKEFMGGGLWPFGSRQAASLANFTGSINTPKGSSGLGLGIDLNGPRRGLSLRLIEPSAYSLRGRRRQCST